MLCSFWKGESKIGKKYTKLHSPSQCICCVQFNTIELYEEQKKNRNGLLLALCDCLSESRKKHNQIGRVNYSDFNLSVSMNPKWILPSDIRFTILLHICYWASNMSNVSN